MKLDDLKIEKTKRSNEELPDLKANEEQAAETKGGAIAGIVIAATSDNNRHS